MSSIFSRGRSGPLPFETPAATVRVDAPTVADGPHLLAVTVLDLDRTLTRQGTWSPFLLFVAARSAPWRLLFLPAVLGAMIGYRAGAIDRKQLKQWMQRLMLGTGVPRARISAQAEAFADRLLAGGLREEALPLIARERAQGRVLILATAAHRFYAESIARRLGIDHVVATESEWRAEKLRPVIVGDNCYGAAKAQALFRYLDWLGIDRSTTHLRCYTDDRSDLPCLEASDERFVVNPKAAMAKLSAARGWPILNLR